MAKIEVRETKLVSCKKFTGPDGTGWKRAEILWENPEFMPGQFLMAARKKKDFPWPSPLMIQKKTKEGFLVYLHQRSPLWSVCCQEELTVWGPCGQGMELEKDYLTVSDGTGSLLIEPMVTARPERCKASYIVGPGFLQSTLLSGREIRLAESIEKMWEQEIVKEETDMDWILALPLEQARKWKENMPLFIRRRTRIVTGVKIGCGIGACRGCYIHGEGASQGIPVCQEGPFLPVESIDYEKDQKFLAHFI